MHVKSTVVFDTSYMEPLISVESLTEKKLKDVVGISTNVDHRIHNQHISLNSLGKAPSLCVDENLSRGAFCACA